MWDCNFNAGWGGLLLGICSLVFFLGVILVSCKDLWRHVLIHLFLKLCTCAGLVG